MQPHYYTDLSSNDSQTALDDKLSAKKVATKAAVSTANASDLATAQALVNDLKTQFNDLLAKMKAAGIMA